MKLPTIKLNTKSIRFRLWAYFVGFSAAILIILWVFQVLLLKPYYTGMIEKSVVDLGHTISANYDKSSDMNEFLTNTQDLAEKNSVSILFVYGNTALYMDAMGNSNTNAAFVNERISEFSPYYNELKATDKIELYRPDRTSRNQGNRMVYAAMINTKDNGQIFLGIAMPMAPVESTVSVLQNQLLIVIAIVLVLSLLVSIFISRRLSRPLTKMSDSAAKLAKGDYNVIFEKGGYDEIDKLASTLNYTTREISKVDQLRRDLIANISHDLRTPLTVIKAYGEMIRDISGNNPEKRALHTQAIIGEADRLTILVNDILDLSKLESGNMQAKPERLDLSTLVRDILKRFDFLVERDGYILSQQIEDNLYIMGDSLRIGQVVYNLVSNAVNYTGDDKQVAVFLRRVGGSVRFEVTDHGPGIPKAEQEFIWDKYYRTKSEHKRSIVGTGLGLSIVKNILVMHNARFGVVSQEGFGSTFWFDIDAAE